MTITVRPVRSQTSTTPYCPQASVAATGHRSSNGTASVGRPIAEVLGE